MATTPRRITTAPRRSRPLSSPTSESEADGDSGFQALDAVVVRLADLSTDGRIAAIAERQRGYVARRQLLRATVDRHAIDRRLANGRLLVRHPGVFSVGHAASGPLHRETAALLAVRDGGALSLHTAGALWGTPGADRDSTEVHVTVPGAEGGHPRGVIVHRSVILTPRDVRIRERLPVTSPARTLLDLASVLRASPLERAVEHLLRTTPTTVGELAGLLERAGAHPGRAALAAMLSVRASSSFTRSDAEQAFLTLIRDAGLPVPRTNVVVHGYELDAYWPKHRVVVEIDGFGFHSSRASFERDRRRDAILAAAGITVVRITWRQLVREPLAVVARLTMLLAEPVAV